MNFFFSVQLLVHQQNLLFGCVSCHFKTNDDDDDDDANDAAAAADNSSCWWWCYCCYHF